jgi:hypothetical protein
MTLADTGIKNLNQRLGVYLTNTLDEPKDYSNQRSLFGFMDAIAEESKSASRIKSEYPIMCVIGNPPYSGESMNKEFVDNAVYKVEIGGKQKLQERNSKWINDDYVKFIRFAESLIEKNGEGIIGMITAHGYIDNFNFRGMRWHLRKTFDKIYVVDLHGNSNKKESTLDGSKDENVFDIKTGVSIILGVKNGKKKEGELGQVLKVDLYGVREDKFTTLDKGSIADLKWVELPSETDLWVLEGKGKSEYKKGFSVAEIDLVMSYNTDNPQSDATRTLQTAITRISAATFDSDVNPNSNDALNLGTSGLNWRNAYFSGTLQVGNNIKLVGSTGNLATIVAGGGVIMKTPNGSACYLVSVTNAGAVTSTATSCP